MNEKKTGVTVYWADQVFEFPEATSFLVDDDSDILVRRGSKVLAVFHGREVAVVDNGTNA